MTPSPQLTVAICTRNRPESLLRTMESVARSLVKAKTAAEIIIIDDGGLDDPYVSSLESIARQTDATSFIHHRKSGRPEGPGLYESRRAAVRMAKAPVILFFDDDVDIASGYIGDVLKAFADQPDLVGVGGIDRQSLPDEIGRLAHAFARMAMLCGPGPGRLSAAGLNYSQFLWRSQTIGFDTQFLHGCNMAFRTKALGELPVLPWLDGHSPCEDLVLSTVAAAAGRLRVETVLGVKHLSIEGGRGDPAERIARKVRSMAAFQRFRGGPWWPLVPAFAGLLLKDLTKACWRSAPFSPGQVAMGYAMALRGSGQTC